jgi:hypothetical protein
MKMKWLCTTLLLLLGVTGLSAQTGTAGTTPPPSAEIAVVKSVSNDNGATWHDAQLAPGLPVNQGDPIRYLVQIVNIGDFPVTGLSVTDTTVSLEGCEMPAALEPAGLVECFTGPIPAPAGQSVNTVLVTAQHNDEILSATDSAYIYAGEVASLNVEKMAGIGGAWYAADNPPGFSVPASREVRFRVVVTNDGTYPFTNIAIADTMLNFADCEIPSVLPPGLSFQCSTGRIEVGTGAQVNTVTVSAVANGQTYSVSDSAHFVVAGELNGDVITIEGEVISIDGNVIVVADRTVVLRPDDPLLAVLEVGDVVRVEGTEDEGGLLTAMFILIVDTDVYVGDGPDDIYRDDGNCGNPPPPWAPAHGWRRKCQLTEVTPGILPPGLRDRKKDKDKNKDKDGRGNGNGRGNNGNNGNGNGNGRGNNGNGRGNGNN